LTKKILAISGSDILSGGGMQADLATYAAFGVKGFVALTSIVTAVDGNYRIHAIDKALFQEQLDSFAHMQFDAIKIGLLPNIDLARQMQTFLKTRSEPVILDPVLVFKEAEDATVTELSDFIRSQLFPLAQIITPNLKEAESLAEMPIQSVSELEIAARKLYASGARRIVIKGGARLDVAYAIDGYFDGKHFQLFKEPLLKQNNTGAGCTFASSIASLSLELPYDQAVSTAKRFVYDAILNSDAYGVFQNS